MGLFGSDSFRLAVSADGSTFFDGLSVDNATGIVDQPRLPRFKAYTNYDNYVGVGSWTKIGLNNTDTNDQSAFDAANNHFVAPVDGTYLFGATLLYKINASATARMSGRLVLNGTTEIRGSRGEISGAHVSRRPPSGCRRWCAHRRRHRRAAGVFPGRGRLLRRRPHVLLGREDRLREARHGTPKTGGRVRPHARA